MPVNVSGIKEMKKALSLVDKDLLKEVQGEIRATMIPIRDKARSYAPADTEVLSGWTKSAGLIGPMRYRTFPKYNQRQVIDGIKYSAASNKRNNKGWSATNYVSNTSAPGAIYETAGRKNPGGNFSPRLPGSIIGQGKMSGRALFKAYAENEGKAQSAVLKAIEDAYKAFQKKGLVFRKAKR